MKASKHAASAPNAKPMQSITLHSRKLPAARARAEKGAEAAACHEQQATDARKSKSSPEVHTLRQESRFRAAGGGVEHDHEAEAPDQEAARHGTNLAATGEPMLHAVKICLHQHRSPTGTCVQFVKQRLRDKKKPWRRSPSKNTAREPVVLILLLSLLRCARKHCTECRPSTRH